MVIVFNIRIFCSEHLPIISISDKVLEFNQERIQGKYPTLGIFEVNKRF